MLIFVLLFSSSSCLDLIAPTDTDNTDPSIWEKTPFEVHFIDVGQADAALVICDGKVMMIDGGNRDDSDLIYSYLSKLGISHIDYMISTHIHEDHVGGLSGALTYATVGTVYAPTETSTAKAFINFASKVKSRGAKITVPTPGTVFSLGLAQVTILGPTNAYDSYEDTNDTSIVLRVVFGETSFLFTGDMESLAEAELLSTGRELKSTVLKVGHHGSYSSTSYRFLKAVAPQYGVISLGLNNEYGHPHDGVMSRLRDADVTIYRTDLQGDIICRSDGKNVTFTTSKNAGVPTNPTESQGTTSSDAAVTEYAYVGNLNTKKFHLIDCSSLPSEENSIYFTTKEEAIENEYTACGICNP